MSFLLNFGKAYVVKILQLASGLWNYTSVPRSWHEALVSAVFKKGGVALRENYRPISLLPIGYKLFASILLRRTVDAGAENRIWHTQFGFCSGRGTADAFFVARRLVESALSEKDGKVILLALNWSKAFDSVDPDRLVVALVPSWDSRKVLHFDSRHLQQQTVRRA